MAAGENASMEDRDAARRLVAKGHELFPRTFRWFWRAAMFREEASEIALAEGVSPGYVRHEVSHIRRTMRTVASRLGIAATLGLLGRAVRQCVVGRVFPNETSVAAPSAPGQPERRAIAAQALRAQGKALCAARQWQQCAEVLGKANALDAAGETSEFKELHDVAEKHLRP